MRFPIVQLRSVSIRASTRPQPMAVTAMEAVAKLLTAWSMLPTLM